MQDPNAVAAPAPDLNEEQQPLPLIHPKNPEAWFFFNWKLLANHKLDTFQVSMEKEELEEESKEEAKDDGKEEMPTLKSYDELAKDLFFQICYWLTCIGILKQWTSCLFRNLKKQNKAQKMREVMSLWR